MFQKLQMNDSFNTMTTYIRGLLPELRSELIKQRPKSLEEAQELALVIEASNKQSNNLSEAVERAVTASLNKNRTALNIHRNDESNAYAFRPTNALQPSAPFCRRCNCMHTFGQHVQPINFRQNQSSRPTLLQPPRQPSRMPFNQNTRQFRPPNYNPQNQQRRTQPNIPMRQTRPNIVCYNCKQMGHTAQQWRRQYLN